MNIKIVTLLAAIYIAIISTQIQGNPSQDSLVNQARIIDSVDIDSALIFLEIDDSLYYPQDTIQIKYSIKNTSSDTIKFKFGSSCQFEICFCN